MRKIDGYIITLLVAVMVIQELGSQDPFGSANRGGLESDPVVIEKFVENLIYSLN